MDQYSEEPVVSTSSTNFTFIQNPFEFFNMEENGEVNNFGHDCQDTRFLECENDLDVTTSSPYLRFVQIPVDSFRFRYESELTGTHGCITAKSSYKGKEDSDFPSVRVENINNNEDVIIRCSLHQANFEMEHFKPHAHRLVQKKRKKQAAEDPHHIVVGPGDNYTAIFRHMGIIHTGKKDVALVLCEKIKRLLKEKLSEKDGKHRSLTQLELKQVDQLVKLAKKTHDANLVCLRFDAFRKVNGVLYPICEPLYSSSIRNLKSAETGNLKIVRRDVCCSPASGDQEVFIFVEKVNKAVKIRFFEEDAEGNVVWEDAGKFSKLDIHYQFAIAFRTPRYKDQNITKPVNVYMQLVRESDGVSSDPLPFKYIPNTRVFTRKRRQIEQDEEEPSTSALEKPDPLLSSSSVAGVIYPTLPVHNTNTFSTEHIAAAVRDPFSTECAEIFEQFGSEWRIGETDLSSLLGGVQQQCDEQLDSCNENVANARHQTKNETKVVPVTGTINSQYLKEEAVDALANIHNNALLHNFLLQNRINELLYFLKLILACNRLELLDIQDDESRTILHLSIITWNYGLTRVLLKCGVNVTKVDKNGNSALHLAIENAAPLELIQLLVDKSGFNGLNSINNDGNTPILIAVEKNNINALKYLYENGADVNRCNEETNISPFSYAMLHDYQDIVQYLISTGAVTINLQDDSSLSNPSTFLYGDDEEIPKSEDNNDFTVLPTEFVSDFYANVKSFTTECLNEVSLILDRRKKYQELADILGLDHLIKSGLISEDDPNLVKKLLICAESAKGGILGIRMLLEQLNEIEAVSVLDAMALKTLKNSTTKV